GHTNNAFFSANNLNLHKKLACNKLPLDLLLSSKKLDYEGW
ncbi:uncharacterized protein METZ01_LOCUS377374, partial [marine metagenome]